MSQKLQYTNGTAIEQYKLVVLFSQNKKLTSAAMVAAGFSFACTTIIFIGIQQTRLRAGTWVRHTWQVIAKIEQAQNDLYELRLAQKDVAILGNELKDNARADLALSIFKIDIQELQVLVADNTKQTQRLKAIEAIIDTTNVNKIQTILKEATQEEIVLLQRRSEWLEDTSIWLSWATIALAISFLVALATVIQLSYKNIEQTKKQELAIAELAHDIRNPIAEITSRLELLALKFPTEKNAIEKLLTLCFFVVELLEDLRFLSTDAIKPQYEFIDIQEFSQKLVEAINAINPLRPNCIVLEYFTENNQHIFLLDKELIRRSLYNLLSNAIAYSPMDSIVNFLVHLDQNALTFKIKDKGIGIPEKDKATLFYPFRRGSNIGQKKGTGLGLAIANQCIKACGGKLWFEERIPPPGTVFFVQLPKR